MQIYARVCLHMATTNQTVQIYANVQTLCVALQTKVCVDHKNTDMYAHTYFGTYNTHTFT